MKRSILTVALAVMAVALFTSVASAEKKAKTVSGKSSCAQCDGVSEAGGHAIMLVDKEGHRWVLLGKGDAYKAAHKVRKDGKNMTATLDGEPTVKKDGDGKEYMEVKISDIKVDA